MSSPRRLVWLAFAALSGCYFLTSFDPEGQPCDPNALEAETQCLSDAGYWCVKNVCKKGQKPADVDAGVDSGVVDPPKDAGADAGTDAGVDGGTDGGVDGGPDGGKTDAGCDGGKSADGGKLDGGC